MIRKHWKLRKQDNLLEHQNLPKLSASSEASWNRENELWIPPGVPGRRVDRLLCKAREDCEGRQKTET